jgi:formate-dependent nitrite reductase membrane component NrfD
MIVHEEGKSMAQAQVEEFTIDFTHQKEWGQLIAVAFFLAGVGAGTFFLSLLLEQVAGLATRGIATLGLLIVAIGSGGAFILDLGHATRFWRALANPASSWISRGVTFIISFIVFGALTIAGRWAPGLPWSDAAIGSVFQYLAMLAAFSVMVYSGFVLVNNPGIAFWNNPLLPIVFILYSFMGGIAVIFVTLPAQLNAQPNIKLLEAIEIWLIVFALIVLGTYLLAMSNSTLGGRRTVRELVKGHYAPYFLGFGICLGLLIPLGIALYVYFSGLGLTSAVTALVIASVLELVGGFFIRYSFLRAAMYSPLL